MTVALVYVYPNLLQGKYQALARQFAHTYLEHPPGVTDHEVYVVVNGFPDAKADRLFEPLPVKLLYHNNWSKDLGAFLLAAHSISCDLLICMGSHIHFHRAGWLDRIQEVFNQYGPALYGPFGSQVPEPHLRTTAFFLPPEILLNYPYLQDSSHRYFLEHGRESIALWSRQMGFEPGQITWSRTLPIEHWEQQSKEECLMLDQHTDRMGY